MSIIITKQPVSKVVTRLNYQFHVECDSNHADATYEWQYKHDGNWYPIPGETHKQYTVVAWNGLDGLYRCKVSKSGVYVYTNIITAVTDKSDPVVTITGVTYPLDAVPEDHATKVRVFAETSDDHLPLSYRWSINSKLAGTEEVLNVEHVTPSMEGIWACEVRSGNTVAFAKVPVKISKQPFIRIITEPVAATVHDDTEASFHCGVITNVEDIKYQWYTKGVGEATFMKIHGQTEPVLSFIAKQATDNNQLYMCKVSSSQVETVESTPGLLTVEGPVTVTITSQPVAITNAPEESSQTFTVVAESNDTRPLTYQWYHNNNIIEGAEQATYEIPSVMMSDKGAYFCEVYGGPDYRVTAQSTTVQLTVKETPATITITTQPKSKNVCSGIAFSMVAAATESENKHLDVQWYLNGNRIKNATEAEYHLADPSEQDSGRYHCVFSSGTGSTWASQSTEEVLVEVVDNLPITLTVDDSGMANSNAVYNQMVELTVTATTTGNEINYQWYEVGTEVGAVPERVGLNFHQLIMFAGRETKKYYCEVFSHGQSQKTKEITLTVTDNSSFESVTSTAYVIVTPAEGTAEVKAEAVSAGTLTYEWMKVELGGVDTVIDGAHTDTLNVHDIHLNEHQTVYCIITDGTQIVRTKYIHVYGSDAHEPSYWVNPLPHRNTSFMYINYWVLDEIKEYISNGDQWIFEYKHMKYSKDVETVITAIKDHGSALMLESRNGYTNVSDLLVHPILG